VIDQNDVKMNSVPFSKGTRYRPDWYTLHVFRRSVDPRDLCFSGTKTLDKLPDCSGGGKWRYWSTFSTSLRGTVAFGICPQEVREEIKKHAYARRRLDRMLRAAS
jgi:hypothetical protein